MSLALRAVRVAGALLFFVSFFFLALSLSFCCLFRYFSSIVQSSFILVEAREGSPQRVRFALRAVRVDRRERLRVALDDLLRGFEELHALVPLEHVVRILA